MSRLMSLSEQSALWRSARQAYMVAFPWSRHGHAEFIGAPLSAAYEPHAASRYLGEARAYASRAVRHAQMS